jgi:hypothetical protein
LLSYSPFFHSRFKMFAKLITLAFALPLVSALTINTPTGATTGGEITLTWTATTVDPTSFTFELYNTIFSDTYAIANTVQTSLGTLTLELPQIPVGDGYILQAVANSNVTDVYAQSGDFSVGAQTTPSTTMASTTASGSTASSVSGVATTTTTTPASLTASSTTSSNTSSGTSSTATPSSFSNGASSFKLGAGPVAVVVLSAMAGAVMVF